MRTAYFAFPGPLRDQLVAAILRGEKTSTCGLLSDYERDGHELPRVGERFRVVDSADQPVGVIETTEVRVIRVDEVNLEFAIEEGEGFTTVAEWREAHERFWHSHADETRAFLGDPDWRVTDETVIVAERFRLVDDDGS
ncbi:MAG TPA: ASCH domain-containing protein [Gaiellaceae bacterium]|nr:ASCH domain-containing protein [Gaiellaceae bacterium]